MLSAECCFSSGPQIATIYSLKMRKLTAATILVLLLSPWAWPEQKRASERLTQNELKQLADILFRLPERYNADIIVFRYVITPVNGVESIEVVLELDSEEEGKKEELEVYRLTRDRCTTFFEDNFGRIVYDNSGKPRATAIYIGGLRESAAYDEMLLHFKSTPVLTFRRKDVSHTCATLRLLDDPPLNAFRLRQKQAAKAEKAEEIEEAKLANPRLYRLTRNQILQLADCITRLGFPTDFSGRGSLRFQYDLGAIVEHGKKLGESMSVMVHSKRLKIGEYLEFDVDRSGKCLGLKLTFTADVLRSKSGPWKGSTEIDDPTTGGNYVIQQTEDYLRDHIFPLPLYVVPAKENHNTCAELTSTDRRYYSTDEPKRRAEEHPPRQKRLTRGELQQLAEALFRLPENQKLKTLRFRYVIAYSEKAEGESIEVIQEPTLRHEPPGFEEFKFKIPAWNSPK